jgi:hypothetical protein
MENKNLFNSFMNMIQRRSPREHQGLQITDSNAVKIFGYTSDIGEQHSFDLSSKQISKSKSLTRQIRKKYGKNSVIVPLKKEENGDLSIFNFPKIETADGKMADGSSAQTVNVGCAVLPEAQVALNCYKDTARIQTALNIYNHERNPKPISKSQKDEFER